MARYHLNPVNGQPGQCRAQHSCPFGGPDEHFDSAADAMANYETVMAGMTIPEPTARQVEQDLAVNDLTARVLPSSTVLSIVDPDNPLGMPMAERSVTQLDSYLVEGEYEAYYDDAEGERQAATVTVDKNGAVLALHVPDPVTDAARTLSNAALVEAVREAELLNVQDKVEDEDDGWLAQDPDEDEEYQAAVDHMNDAIKLSYDIRDTRNPAVSPREHLDAVAAADQDMDESIERVNEMYAARQERDAVAPEPTMESRLAEAEAKRAEAEATYNSLRDANDIESVMAAPAAYDKMLEAGRAYNAVRGEFEDTVREKRKALAFSETQLHQLAEAAHEGQDADLAREMRSFAHEARRVRALDWSSPRGAAAGLAAVRTLQDQLDHLGNEAAQRGEDPELYYQASGSLEALIADNANFA